MIADDARGQRFFHPEVLQLREQAFAQIARGDAGRIETLHAREHALDFGGRDFELRRQLVERSFEIAVFVEIVDDSRADRLVGFGADSTS